MLDHAKWVKMTKRKHKPKKDKFNQFIQYSNLSFEMIAIIGAGSFIGYKIDKWLNISYHIFLLIFIILSVIGAILYAMRNFIKKK